MSKSLSEELKERAERVREDLRFISKYSGGHEDFELELMKDVGLVDKYSVFQLDSSHECREVCGHDEERGCLVCGTDCQKCIADKEAIDAARIDEAKIKASEIADYH